MPGIEQAAAIAGGDLARVDEILRAACRVVVAGGASDLRIGSVAAGGGGSREPSSTTTSRPGRSSCVATFAYAEDLRSPRSRRSWRHSRRRRARGMRSWPDDRPRARGDTGALERGLVEPALRRRAAPARPDRYRAWIDRIVRLLDEGPEDGSVPRVGRSRRGRVAARSCGRRPRLDPLPRARRPRGRACARVVVRRELARDAALAVGRSRKESASRSTTSRPSTTSPRDRQRRVLLAARPVRLRQDDDVPHDRGLRATGRRAHQRSATRTSPRRRRTSAASRRCSRTSRSSRTSVEQNVGFGLRFKDVAKDERRGRVA